MLSPIWTVLIVEDDDELRDSAAAALQRAGFAAFTAATVSAAIHLVRSFPGRCLIVLDLSLGDGNGRELLETLPSIRRAATRFPVLVASGEPDAKELERFPYVVGVLQKPFGLKTLVSNVIEQANTTLSSVH